MLVLSTALQQQLKDHGEEAYPNECCGFLVGRLQGSTKLVEDLWRVDNSREPEAARRRFLMSPQHVLEAEKRSAREKVDILGVYHSHPDHPAEPSQFDLEHAWPFYSYPIVSVQQGKAESLRSWLLAEDRSTFHEETIEEEIS